MVQMNINQEILKVSDMLKPVLKKIFPQRLLQNIKNIFVERNYDHMVKEGRRPFNRKKYPEGINLVGLVRAEMGLGQSCRLLANALENSNIAYSLYDFQLGSELMKSEDHSWDEKISEDFLYNINLFNFKN